jgi:metal-sulfur cluster biosynthetic enzyme
VDNLVDQIKTALKEVKDPELRLDVCFLGLIREILVKEEEVIITMTLTSPACPAAGSLVDEVQKKAAAVVKNKEVKVELTFSPPWTPPDEVKELFGWS